MFLDEANTLLLDELEGFLEWDHFNRASSSQVVVEPVLFLEMS